MTYTALPNLLKYLRSFDDLESVCVGEASRAQLLAEIEAALADSEKLAKVMDAIEHHIADHQSASQTIEAILNITAP